MSSAVQIPSPSTWFAWHDRLLRPGARVLDLAFRDARHGLAAARRGAFATVAGPPKVLDEGRGWARQLELELEWQTLDPSEEWKPLGRFDAVLVFNYLDRARMPWILEQVAPGGVLLMETWLESQRELGWGPQDPAELLRPGELARLVAPHEVLHGREALEPVSDERWRAVASIAVRRAEG